MREGESQRTYLFDGAGDVGLFGQPVSRYDGVRPEEPLALERDDLIAGQGYLPFIPPNTDLRGQKILLRQQ